MLVKLFDIYKSKKEVFNYIFFGILTTIVNLVTYFLLTSFLLDSNNQIQLQIANVLSWIFAVLFAYFTNRKYVFESVNENKINELKDFFVARLLTLGFDMVIMYLGVSILNGNDRIIKIISQVVVIVSNYILSKLFVFNERRVK